MIGSSRSPPPKVPSGACDMPSPRMSAAMINGSLESSRGKDVEVALVSTSVVGASVCVVRIEVRILSTWLNTVGKGRADGRIGHDLGPRALSARFSRTPANTRYHVSALFLSLNETEIG